MTIFSILALVLTLVLPYIPFANQLELVPLPLKTLAAMLLIVFSYIITADLLKVWFFNNKRFIEKREYALPSHFFFQCEDLTFP